MDSIWLLTEIAVINLVLSGDNAVVIAMLSKSLPDGEQIKAMWLGSIGAVLFRIILTLGAIWIIHIPLLKAVSGVMLFIIAIQLLTEHHPSCEQVDEGQSLWGTIRMILLVDIIMSLDNVLAISAISKGNVLYVIIGIAISIPILVWGSSFIRNILERIPILTDIGAAILGYTAGEMIATDGQLSLWLPTTWLRFQHGMPWLIMALIVLYACLIKRKQR